MAGDAFRVARALAAAGERFGVVVVDPPAFVKRKADLEAGLRGYKDVNLHAMRLVEPGGLLLTCSCSALVGEEQFGEMLAAAALDAGRTLRVLERRGAGPGPSGVGVLPGGRAPQGVAVCGKLTGCFGLSDGVREGRRHRGCGWPERLECSQVSHFFRFRRG